MAEGTPSTKEAAPPDDDAAADRYLEIKERIEADPTVATGDQFPEIRRQLEEIANGAGAAPLRANAALLLGSLFDARGDALKASGYYQHAVKLVPDDAGPYMALAVASASAKDFAGAVAAQQKAAELDPDNLENWLALGELRMRAGDQDGSVQAYVSYELRRKGLIDGLTLHDGEGTYVVGVDERIACANALAAAADQGTGMALVYALRTEPEARVRAAIARVMGIHRLEMYLPVLQTQSAEERDPDAKEAVGWAMGQIAQDPVKIDATERPRLPDDDPRASEGEVPRAEEAPVAPTKESTQAPEGATAAEPGGGAAAEGSAAEGQEGSAQGATSAKSGAQPSDPATGSTAAEG